MLLSVYIYTFKAKQSLYFVVVRQVVGLGCGVMVALLC